MMGLIVGASTRMPDVPRSAERDRERAVGLSVRKTAMPSAGFAFSYISG